MHTLDVDNFEGGSNDVGGPPADDSFAHDSFEVVCEPEPPDLHVDEGSIEALPAGRRMPRRITRAGFGIALALSLGLHAASIGTVMYFIRQSRSTTPWVSSPSQIGGLMLADNTGVSTKVDLSVPPSRADSKLSLPELAQPKLEPDDSLEFLTPKHTVDVSDDTFDEKPGSVFTVPGSSDQFAVPHLPATARSPWAAIPTVPNKAAPVAAPPSISARGGNGGNQNAAKNGYDDRGLAKPDYPAECRRHHQQGLVLLDVEVLKDGTAGKIVVLKDPGFRPLVDAAIEAVRESPFEPARVDGVPTDGHLQIPFRFVLD